MGCRSNFKWSFFKSCQARFRTRYLLNFYLSKIENYFVLSQSINILSCLCCIYHTNENHQFQISPELLTIRISPELLTIRISPELLTIRISSELSKIRISPELLTIRISPELLTIWISPELLQIRKSPELLLKI